MVTPILKAAVDLQSLALMGHSAKLATKKKKKASDFVKVGVGTIVGTELIKTQSQLINTI